MTTTKIWLIIVVFLVAVSLAIVADGALSWGTFLGANWKDGEGEEGRRQELVQSKQCSINPFRS